jgi:hypothetical protein
MSGLLSKLFGRGSGHAHQARAAELRGDLAQAAALFAEAGRLDEAARVMILRGDAEADAASRLRHYTQAAATAPEGSAALRHARKKRALLVVAMAADAPVTATLRADLLDAGRELEAIGQPDRAAEAYARAGDVEGEARALARAGEIDKLDALLLEAQGRDRDVIARQNAQEEMSVLVATGRRREAAAVARGSSDEGLRERGRALEERRAAGSVVRVVLRGRAATLALGDEVVVGRAGTIAVASAALSRRHAAVARRGDAVVVRDLGSRNGTILRGLRLAGEAVVGDGIEVKLGGEVAVTVRPTDALPGAVLVEVAGAVYVAPLGPAVLGVGAWRLEAADDGWVELATDDATPAFAAGIQLASRVTLLAGDAVASRRDGPPELVVER